MAAIEACRQRSGIHISGVTLDVIKRWPGSVLLALFPYSR
jgi:hypothetical protein